jgi:hypothetical protein
MAGLSNGVKKGKEPIRDLAIHTLREWVLGGLGIFTNIDI